MKMWGLLDLLPEKNCVRSCESSPRRYLRSQQDSKVADGPVKQRTRIRNALRFLFGSDRISVMAFSTTPSGIVISIVRLSGWATVHPEIAPVSIGNVTSHPRHASCIANLLTAETIREVMEESTRKEEGEKSERAFYSR